MTKAIRAAVAALSILVFCFGADAAPLAAQSGMDDLVRMQLDSAAVLVASEGFVLERDYQSGWLADGQSEEVSMPLIGGRSYVIMGVCDVDCSDLDLVLYGEDGAEVDSDYELDDFPMVVADPAEGSVHTLTVSMPACSIEPCGYGVAVFARTR